MRVFTVLSLAVVLAAGCSAFPGLRVLSGEDVTGTNAEVAQVAEIVMADKSGQTDPSLMAAADRIEAAAPFIDIVEIRKDIESDAFLVNMMFEPPAGADGQDQAALISLYTSIQKAIELTWQGTLRESEGSGVLQVNFIVPQGVPTLNSGTSFIGVVTRNSEIERSKAIDYLSGSRDLNAFLDLIVDGTLLYDTPPGGGALYTGHPNHPLFMLAQADVAAGAAS